MRFLRSLLPSLLLLGAGITEAASSWSFDEGVISVGKEFKDKSVDHIPALAFREPNIN